jgi:glycosyltransferase involved in cell wall biosynthesis
MTLANGFAERGLPTDLVLSKAEGPYLDRVSSKVDIIDLGARGIATSLPGLVRYLRKAQPQTMISALSHANVIAIWAKVLSARDVRLIVSEHSQLTTNVAHSMLASDRLLPRLVRWSYPLADGIVAISRSIADDLSSLIGSASKKIAVIYNPIDLEQISAMAVEPVPHPWLVAPSVPVIIGVGRLAAEKDFKLLIDAFAKLRAKRPARLIILGEGEQRNFLSEHVRNIALASDVSLPGFVANPFAWMKRASVFVLSSKYEGLSNALIEAMACGIPVVSADCGGPAEILQNGKWGKLVPVGDSDALAQAIAATLDADVLPNVRQRAGDFSTDRALDAYLMALNPAPLRS